MEAKEAEAKEAAAEKEPYEPGGRKQQLIDKMSSEALAAAYGDGVRFRSHAICSWTDDAVARWLGDARSELRKRGQLDLIKEYLPVYFDPSRNPPVFGPGAPVLSQTAIERVIAPRALKPAG
jgi:hypothetical protein